MKKWKDLNRNEKTIIIMLLISVVMVIISWERVSSKTVGAFKYYFAPTQQISE
jgi:cell division protein FtsL